jgi:hypothetical protein
MGMRIVAGKETVVGCETGQGQSWFEEFVMMSPTILLGAKLPPPRLIHVPFLTDLPGWVMTILILYRTSTF